MIVLRDLIKERIGQIAAGIPLIHSPRRDTSYIEHTLTRHSTRIFIEWRGINKESWDGGLVKIEFTPIHDREDKYGYINAVITRVDLAETGDHLEVFYRLTISYFAQGIWDEEKSNSRQGVIVQKSFRTLLEAMEFAETCLTYDDILMYLNSYI